MRTWATRVAGQKRTGPGDRGLPARFASGVRRPTARRRGAGTSPAVGADHRTLRLDVVVAVVDEPEPVGDAEAVADRRQERREHAGADLHDVVRLEEEVGLLAAADLGQVHAD